MFGRKRKKKLSRRQKRAQPAKKPDMQLLVVILFLSFWGAIMIYSGSVLVAVKQGYSPYFYFVRQLAWVAIGIIGGYVAFSIDYKLLPKLAVPGLVFAISGLILVLILNWGSDIKRWIDLGPFDLQPSEITKLVFLVYLAGWLAKQKTKYKSFKAHVVNELIPFLILLFSVSFLILIEPDLDTTIILGVTSFIVYFVAGNDKYHLIGSLSTGGVLAGLVGIAISLAKYRVVRLFTFINFWAQGSSISDPFGAGYQLRQILVAVASGGVFGVGFGESRQKFHYLGETAFSDTIFAIFAEEFGLVGSVILTGLFLYILLKGYKIAKNAPDKLSFLLAVGITTWISLQAFMHIAANVALIPINGNTLPFISYGGSSTVVNLTAMGLLLNISKYSKQDESN